MPKVALVSFYEWHDSSGCNMDKIIESIGEWTEIDEKEHAVLKNHILTVNRAHYGHQLGLLVREDYAVVRNKIHTDIKKALEDARARAEKAEKEAVEKLAKRGASLIERKRKQLEKLQQEVEAAEKATQ